ncbi:hypothetical protein V2G26_014119 [Clonostachys chloroleuca]|uniref:Uncharacterized protein n=1 Tax=Clonostachys chloroleuca TaxID=1926264 RepID=A0AA35PYJ4_9HYPO|nr:unnamed protein product [Clonostachys chloroleuca]
MYSTKAVHALKNLFSRYHEPTALSKTQAQKLLEGLKSSFRDQLDREHGHNVSDIKRTKIAAPTTSAELRTSPTDQHLKTLLSNPLFSYNEPTESPPLGPAIIPNQRDPMDVFDHAVSKGMMTIRAATGCLITKRKQMKATQGDLSVLDGSDTALRVLRWIRSSRSEHNLDFLDNRPFVNALMPFLISEGLENVAWEWVTRSLRSAAEEADHATQHGRAEFVLSNLVAVKGLPQYGDLDAAIVTLLRAQNAYQASPFLSELLWKPWRSISWLSTVESHSRAAPNEILYNAHVATAEKFVSSVAVEQAHLSLWHPTHPSVNQALSLFRDTGKMDGVMKSISKEGKYSSKNNRMKLGQWLVVLGHDTVDVLARSGRAREAKEVAELLKMELSDYHHQHQTLQLT